MCVASSLYCCCVVCCCVVHVRMSRFVVAWLLCVVCLGVGAGGVFVIALLHVALR